MSEVNSPSGEESTTVPREEGDAERKAQELKVLADIDQLGDYQLRIVASVKRLCAVHASKELALQQTISTLQEEKKKHNWRLESEKELLSELDQAHAEGREVRASLAAAKAETEVQVQLKKKYQAQVEAHEATEAELRQTIDELRKDKTELMGKEQLHLDFQGKLNTELKQVRGELQNAQSKLNSAEQQHELSLGLLTVQLNETKSELDAAQQTEAKLRRELHILRTQTEGQQTQLEKLNDDRELQKLHKLKALKMVRELQEQVHDPKVVRQAEQLRTENERLRAEVADLRRVRQEKIILADRLTHRLLTVQDELVQAKAAAARVPELEVQIQELRAYDSAEITRLQGELTQSKRALSSMHEFVAKEYKQKQGDV